MADEVRRVAAKGCHAVSFSENPSKLKLPSFHSDHWDPFWAACSDEGTHRVPAHRLVVVAGGDRARRPHRRPHRAAARQHRPGRRRSAVVAGAAEVPRPARWRCRRAGSAGSRTSSTAWTGSTRATTAGRGRTSASKLPSQVFAEQVVTCFIDDPAGVELRHRVGIDSMCWEADYPHSDSTWPQSPEMLMKSLDGVPDEEIEKFTYRNAMRHYRFDPFAHRPKEQCTVGALRARAVDVDVTPRPGNRPTGPEDDQGHRPHPPSRHQPLEAGPRQGLRPGVLSASTPRGCCRSRAPTTPRRRWSHISAQLSAQNSSSCPLAVAPAGHGGGVGERDRHTGSGWVSGPRSGRHRRTTSMGCSRPRIASSSAASTVAHGGSSGDHRRHGQHLVAHGQVAQPGGDVHGVADVVVALEEDDRPRRDPALDGDGLGGDVDGRLHLQGGRHQRHGVDAHEHGAVSEPFGDAHGPARADVAQRRAEHAEHGHGPFVTLGLGEGGEPRQVEEGECPSHAHAAMIAPAPVPGRARAPDAGAGPGPEDESRFGTDGGHGGGSETAT